MTQQRRVYLAGPLFSLAERDFNVRFSDAIKKELAHVTVILPQESASTFLGRPDWHQLIFNDCLESISTSDAIIALLEGPDADSGTSLELGYAYAKGIPIIGIRTDFRGSEDRGLNLMLSHVCKELVCYTMPTDFETLVKDVTNKLIGLTASFGR